MIYLLIIIVLVCVETKIKNYVEENIDTEESKDLFDGKITLRKHYNRGMFLNYLENKKEIVKTVSLVCLGLLLLLFTLLLPKKGNKLYKLGLSFVIGGAISNVHDRINRGYVVDYFSINQKKLKNIIFNISDFCIFFGTLIVTIASLFGSSPKRSTNETTE